MKDSNTLKPRDARTFDDMCRLNRDNYPGGADQFSILLGEEAVSLHAPVESGQASWFEIPRDQFESIIDWYNKPQKLRRKRTGIAAMATQPQDQPR